MAKKRVFMVFVFVLLSTMFAAGAFAQVTISGGLALSSIEGTEVRGDGYTLTDINAEIGIGGNIYMDYLLPVSVPLSLGFEFGVDTAKFTIKNGIESLDEFGYESFSDAHETITVIPLLFRVAYHLDLLAKLDLYLVGKIGYAFGFWEGDFYTWSKDAPYNGKSGDIGGLAFGFDIGAALYLSPRFGFFVEAGFDSYALEAKLEGDAIEYYESQDYSYHWEETLIAPFKRFVTFGISTKF
jgi:hypothetical protein